MDLLVLAAADINMLWYLLPLIIAVSLVYSATRHEAMRPILYHAWRVGVWIVGFMLVVIVVLKFIEWWV
jgi:hypothetical protein